jgi:Cyclic nucleotide-binding domain
MPTATTFVEGLLDPRVAALHLSWALLVLAMLMRDVVWLRTLAIASALATVIAGAAIIYSPVSVVWGLALALVNLLQLGFLLFARRHPKLTEDERLLADRLLPGMKGRRVERLLDRVEWRAVEFADKLVTPGQPVEELMLVADGAARVEYDGRVVGVLSRGDLVAEDTFASGGTALVEIVAARPMKLASLSREELDDLGKRDKVMRRALAARLSKADPIPPAEEAPTAQPVPEPAAPAP